jgi:hypothetical protein
VVAQKFDVASRLAEGRPAVENVQNYVWACHLLGYQHPDLTLHRTQVRDGYGTEDGLDLRALDADCAALEAAVAATQDAVTRQDDQLAAVSTAWQGRGAEAAREFLRRHGHASAAASAALRTAADALAVLRDDLWQAVDAKVAAAVAIDGQTLSQRAAWLAAAQTVTTGVGDRAAASERIDQEVKPFVDNNIRVDWLSAMRAATAAVSDAYAKVIAELRAEPDAIFDVPGDLGPSWTPPPDDVKPAAAAAPPVWSAPPASMTAPSSAAPAAPPAPPVPVPPPPVPVPPPVDTAPMAAPPMPAMPSAGGMGGGLPDMGGGLSGFGQQLADSLGGLLGSTDDALRDPLEFDEPEDDDEDDDEHDKPEKEPTQPDEAQPAEETVAPAGEVCAPPTAGPPPVVPPPAPVEPEPAPVAVPPPPEPVVPPEPPVPADRLTATGTPCEIAADELPQAGQ